MFREQHFFQTPGLVSFTHPVLALGLTYHFNVPLFFVQLTERDATIKELHSLIDQIKEERLQDEEVRYQRSILAKRQVYIYVCSAKSVSDLCLSFAVLLVQKLAQLGAFFPCFLSYLPHFYPFSFSIPRALFLPIFFVEDKRTSCEAPSWLYALYQSLGLMEEACSLVPRVSSLRYLDSGIQEAVQSADNTPPCKGV